MLRLLLRPFHDFLLDDPWIDSIAAWLNDLLLQHIRRRQVIQIVQAVILEPKDIETGLITRHQFFIVIEPEAFSSAALVAILRVVAGDEVL